jgi:acetyltransferase
VERHRLADGTEILVRAIGPDDEPLIEDLHAHHSADTIHLRFFGLVKTLSREMLTRLCRLDPQREVALAALHQEPEGRPHIIGVSRYHLTPETGEAEFAIVVTDAWQGKGVGYHLMQRLEEVARQRGAKRLIGDVLRENARMRQLMGALGFTMQSTNDPAVMRVVKGL